MSVREVTQALGSWALRLRQSTPRELLDVLKAHPFGHIAVVPGRVNVAEYGDQLLAAARYVGVYRARFNQGEEYEIKGVGMAFWLGDEDGKGDVFEAAVTITAQTFANSVRALLPPSGAVTEGTLFAGVAGTYTGTHRWETPRKALTYVTDTFSTEAEPVEWRVSGNGTLDAGKVADLYSVTAPKVMLVRRGVGADLLRRAMPGELSMDADTEDYTTRLILLAEGEGASTATGSANGPATPYNDIHGNAVKLTRLVSESTTSGVNAAARASAALVKYIEERRAAQLSTSDYDVKGDLVVGDALDVYDPETGFTDPTREVYWQGVPINPMTLRVVEMTWPIRAGWTIGFRDNDGVWYDLSDHFVPEGGDTQIVVGSFKQRLGGGGSEPVGGRPVPDKSTPATPVFGAFATGSYQPGAEPDTKAFIGLTWTKPLNTDGSTVLDGSHYEIRYRPNATLPYPATWDEVATRDWSELFTWDQPLVPPIVATDWHVIFVGFDQESHVVQELTPGVDYEFQIRAVDMASPPNKSAWSATTTKRAARDQLAPETPAAPTVAGSRISIQVTHLLGQAAGGTFNLASDLDHLEVHVGGDPTFHPSDQTRVGRLLAGAALHSSVPVVGTFAVESVTQVNVKVVAVDRTGNKSAASAAATVTASLIDDAHIESLTVSKVTAGTITAQWILAGLIATGLTGNRIEQDSAGLRAYNPDGVKTLEIDAATGSLTCYDNLSQETIRLDGVTGQVTVRGTIRTNIADQGVTIIPGSRPRIELRPDTAATHRGVIMSRSDETFGNISQYGIERDSDGQVDGGMVMLWETGAMMRLNINNVSIGHIWLSNFPTNGRMIFKGYTQGMNGDADGTGFNGLFGPFNAASGTVSYGATMTSIMIPVALINGNRRANALTSANTTGFTLTWDTVESHSIFAQAWRN